MSEAIVRELWSYPVKSCQGVPVEAIEVTEMGVRGDREFALWHEGELVEQKDNPQVASLAASLAGDCLRFRHAEHGEYEHVVRSEGPAHETRWVLDQFESVDQGDAVAAWLSGALGRPVRLVRPGATWKINFPIPAFERVHDRPKQSFFSASPLSLANRASLDDLNARLEAPVPMDRFRMNVVVDGLEAYEEDALDSLASDEVELLNVTAAERCAIITTDQKTGERPKSDLMKVLAEYRRKPKEERFGSGLIFGAYMTVAKSGTLRTGDRLVAR
jgi:hypothetical protein